MSEEIIPYLPVQFLGSIIHQAEQFVRTKGLYIEAEVDLKKEYTELDLCSKSKEIRDEIIEFVKAEASKAKPEERLLGSSEVIESVFGKQKMIENAQASSGFTGLILSISAIVSKNDQATIEQAMRSIKVKDALDWIGKKIGVTPQAKRKRLLGGGQAREQKWNQSLGTV